MNLSDAIQVLPGVGEKRAENLQTLGIATIEDLLTYYPFRYEDIQEKELQDIQDQEKVTLKGTVISEPVVTRFGYKKNRLVFRMMKEHAVINVSFFNQPYLKDKIVLAADIAVYGKWDAKKKALNGMKILASGTQDEFVPIYHTNKQVRQQTLVSLIRTAFTQYGALIAENLPTSLLEKYRLMPREQAMTAMHFPKHPQEYQQAKRRLIFEEFFFFQLNIQGIKKQEKAAKYGQSIAYDVAKLKQFTRQLPFELTVAQKRVTNEICRDMLQPLHMQRLLQGDVGSGKTIIAAICLYAAITAGFQGALMVPTEILAQQHMQQLTQLFAPFSVRVALLTGATKAKERQAILQDLANGQLDIVIGTHALIQGNVIFSRLGLAIIDEQHRFGVNQRKLFREKGQTPDVLFMTATPIPRTLAITAFGEMDISVLDELPAGRKPIETRWVRPNQLESVLTWITKELANGHQAYVICPLIEESEVLDVKNVLAIYQQMAQFFAPTFQVGLLHGKMKNQEKEDIMHAFQEQAIQILVSTTVIEVGVNVPNATVMLVMDADRFGLAQLHQLRGRVGRGAAASYCILIANPKNETGAERMKIMTETNDGFVLSEKDLKMRGPGEIFGFRQSGVPQFLIGDLVNDEAILEVARQEAANLWQQERWWEQAEYQVLARAILALHPTKHFFD